MTDEMFVLLLAVGLCALLGWAFRVLPGERWQMLFASPARRVSDTTWSSINWTFYGFFTATAAAVAVALGLVLLAAVGVEPPVGGLLIAGLLAVCYPSSRVVARLIERKQHTFTVGGATFVGVLLAPWLVRAVGAAAARKHLGVVPYVPTLAAMCIGIAAGEAIGRLACISFGCCYGRPIESSPRWARRLFARASFTFHGATKKAAYAAGLDGVALVPIQGVTAAVLATITVTATYLFLGGHFVAALLVSGLGTQGWRVASELFRDDYRGGGRVSAYQKLAIAGAAYLVVAALAPMLAASRGGVAAAQAPSVPSIANGLGALWSAEVIVSLELLWMAVFVYTGRSTVTASTLSFHVLRDRV